MIEYEKRPNQRRYEDWWWRVRDVAMRVKVTFTNIPQRDIEQECWAWVFSHKKATPFDKGIAWLEAHMMNWAWEEVQQLQGNPRPLYTDREMTVFIKVIFSEDMKAKAQPSWEAWFNEVEAAMNRLEQYDKDILYLRFAENRSLRQIGEEIGISTSTADRHVWEAIGRLQDILQPEVEEEKEYTRKGNVISNARARSIIADAN